MPRPVPAFDVQKARADNYAHHFECREYCKNMDSALRQKYLDLVRCVNPAHINIFGATDRKKEDWDTIIDLANQYDVDCWFINPFYLTDIGWEAFQEEWKNLPELVHIPCVQVEPLVPIVHTRERIQYTKR